MARKGIDELLHRSIGDAEFRKRFEEHPERVLDTFQLTELERAGVMVLNMTDLVSSVEAFVPPCPPNVPI